MDTIISLLDIKFDLEYQYGILNIFKSAFKEFHKFTCIKFIPNTNEKDYPKLARIRQTHV